MSSNTTDTSKVADVFACILTAGDEYIAAEQRYVAVVYFCMALTAINLLFSIFYLSMIERGRTSPPCGIRKSAIFKFAAAWYASTGVLKLILASLLFSPVLQPACPSSCSETACGKLAPTPLGPTLFLLVSLRWLQDSHSLMKLSGRADAAVLPVLQNDVELPTHIKPSDDYSETTASSASYEHEDDVPSPKMIDIGTLA